jgi:hypothetical protein
MYIFDTFIVMAPRSLHIVSVTSDGLSADDLMMSYRLYVDGVWLIPLCFPIYLCSISPCPLQRTVIPASLNFPIPIVLLIYHLSQPKGVFLVGYSVHERHPLVPRGHCHSLLTV